MNENYFEIVFLSPLLFFVTDVHDALYLPHPVQCIFHQDYINHFDLICLMKFVRVGMLFQEFYHRDLVVNFHEIIDACARIKKKKFWNLIRYIKNKLI